MSVGGSSPTVLFTLRERRPEDVTVDGKEGSHFQANPWASLAIREVERARDLCAVAHFDAAADHSPMPPAGCPRTGFFKRSPKSRAAVRRIRDLKPAKHAAMAAAV